MDGEERLPELLGNLDTQLDSLSGALEPLLNQPLSQTASKLPLLDGAKLNVLTAYTLYTLVFNALKLNGVDAQAHPVYKELARVKEYFKRITEAEHKGAGSASTTAKRGQPTSRVDKEAAARFVRHGLAGNHSNHHKRFGNDDDIDAAAIQRRVDERQAAEGRHQQKSSNKSRSKKTTTKLDVNDDRAVSVPQFSSGPAEVSNTKGKGKVKKRGRDGAPSPDLSSQAQGVNAATVATKRMKLANHQTARKSALSGSKDQSKDGSVANYQKHSETDVVPKPQPPLIEFDSNDSTCKFWRRPYQACIF